MQICTCNDYKIRIEISQQSENTPDFCNLKIIYKTKEIEDISNWTSIYTRTPFEKASEVFEIILTNR